MGKPEEKPETALASNAEANVDNAEADAETQALRKGCDYFIDFLVQLEGVEKEKLSAEAQVSVTNLEKK